MRPRFRSVAAGLLASALLLGGLAGCTETPPTATPPSGPSTGTPVTYPVTAGGVTLNQQPARIVSLSPTATEMLFSIGAGKQVVAVDDNSNFPPDAPKSDLSGFKPDAEAVAAKNPDLVVLSNDTENVVAGLTKLKIPVYQAPAATNIGDSYRQITEIGALTGHLTEANDLVGRMTAEIGKLLNDLPKRGRALTYYYELDPTYYTVTEKTFIGSLFTMAGMRNIARPGGAGGDYPQLSAEVIVKANPDLIFLADTKCCKQSPETVKARPGWAAITAVKNNQVYGLDDDIASRWGPRAVALLQAITTAAAHVPA